MGRRIKITAALLIAAGMLIGLAGCEDLDLLTTIRGMVDETYGTTIPVTGVSLDKESITIPVGGTEQLTATVEPADATDQSVTWSIDNENVATVDTDGLVTATAEGAAAVTVTTTDGGFTAECAVTVSNTAKEITAFGFTASANTALSSDITGTINGTDISAAVPYGTDVTALVASFTTTGASVAVGVTPQISGTTANDFKGPVTYTVTAGDDSTRDYTVTVTIAALQAGDTETYTADGVSFDLAYVPGGLTFPTGTDDNDGNATVSDAYWIADTQVTYELWYTVYTWATTGSSGTGAGQYSFANAGREGNDGTDGADPTGADQEPVTSINWRDSMVWCNALTEWYNAQEGTSYECVYTYTGSIIRDSTNATACDGADAGATANGFRLLTSNEWELAARYRGTDTTHVVTGTIDGVDFDAMTTKWTKGNSASGATTYYNDNTEGSGEPGKSANDAVAVYRRYWNGTEWEERTEYSDGTETVAGLTANTLGLYDMSGNVWEWCFTESGSHRIIRGGNWYSDADDLRVGDWSYSEPGFENFNLGLRLCRTAD